MRTQFTLKVIAFAVALFGSLQVESPITWAGSGNQILEWNQVFVDTLVATNTPHSFSQRLGAMVHTAIFDAFNGIDRRYTPLFVESGAPQHASRGAAVVAAAYTALAGLFPSQQATLDARYEASLSALRERCRTREHSHGSVQTCMARLELGVTWGVSTWPTPSSPGALPTDSLPVTHPSPEERPLASGGRRRPLLER
jgi:hypothetical protein